MDLYLELLSVRRWGHEDIEGIEIKESQFRSGSPSCKSCLSCRRVQQLEYDDPSNEEGEIRGLEDFYQSSAWGLSVPILRRWWMAR